MLRNREIRTYLIFYIFLTGAGTLLGSILDTRAGVLVFILCSLSGAAWFAGAVRRYKNMARFSEEIDTILHGGDNVYLSGYAEGELSLLESEVRKLVVKLREQTDSLKNEKVYLADSIADISHQIRTPLTSMNLIGASLCKDDLSDDERKAKLFEMQKLIGRIDWLVSALLKMAKLDTGTITFRREWVSFEALICKAMQPLAIPMELKEQELVMQLSGGFTGDLSWTAEAVTNILKNCMEHMERGKLYISGEENALYSQMIIRDTGRGIAREDLPHLFERFYKGKNASEQSVGIGLALSRMIITRQNGTIKAENGKSGGAEFTIRFYKSVI